MRVLPHHQNSGGFFIAVLQKNDWLPWQRKQRLNIPTTTSISEQVSSASGVLEEEKKTNVVPKLNELAAKVLSVESAEDIQMPATTGISSKSSEIDVIYVVIRST